MVSAETRTDPSQITGFYPMKNILFPVRAARASHGLNPDIHSDHMLSGLLALHEQLIEQLRLEHMGAIIMADFLTGMIDQHEKAVALLKGQLESPVADDDSAAVIPREDSDDREGSLVTRLAQGSRVPLAFSAAIHPRLEIS